MLIDLSQAITDNSPVYPDSKKMWLRQVCDMEKNGFVSYFLHSDMHNSTHIDLPMHFGFSDKTVDLYALENFIGQGVAFDVKGYSTINLQNTPLTDDYNNKCLLFHTGFSEKYGKTEYYHNHPTISIEFAKALVKFKVKLVGFDTPSPDFYPYDVHKLLLNNNIFIVENLTNIEKLLQKKFEFFAFPLKIAAEASLIRAVASIEE
ncbi:MAG: cyclase family protein [Clostridia bacterium]